MLEPFGWDVFMRHTSPDGKSHVQQHRAWDRERFVASQVAAAAKVNNDQPAGKPRKANAEQITQEQYLKERRHGHRG